MLISYLPIVKYEAIHSQTALFIVCSSIYRLKYEYCLSKRLAKKEAVVTSANLCHINESSYPELVTNSL